MNGRHYDANEKARQLIAEAVTNATPKPKPGVSNGGGPTYPSPGKVIAELSFGF